MNELAVPLLDWSFEPWMVVLIAAGLLVYGIGRHRMISRSRRATKWVSWRSVSYVLGMLVLAVALVSPLDQLDGQLFWVHMIQHMLLILVAAPLLLAGAPLLPWLWILPERQRQGVAHVLFSSASPLHSLFHFLTTPLVSVGIFGLTLAYWHVPAFYNAAQGHTVVHALEHLMFFGTGLLYWWSVLHPSGGQRRLGFGFAVLYLIPPLIEGPLIGALLTFAPAPIYAAYQHPLPVYGFTSIQDQQLGGLIMWIPSGFIYLGAVFACLTLFLRQEERRANEPMRNAYVSQ